MHRTAVYVVLGSRVLQALGLEVLCKGAGTPEFQAGAPTGSWPLSGRQEGRVQRVCSVQDGGGKALGSWGELLASGSQLVAA